MFSNRKKITFDVVGKLSLYKYEQLCVRSRNDITALRVLCSRFGSRPPVKRKKQKSECEQLGVHA